ncbi:hypothetical protein LCGC14_1046180 [marine sediment metagenome]|uniref:Uncharacterized protein n=1 Tax=marine sediment metagenome TaxID=412755 RepID=A0A0F9NBZ9_9ZZZZ
MKIAFIGDQPGKVHQNRCNMFRRYIPHSFDFFTHNRKTIRKIAKKYDIIYYASFTLYKKCPIKHPLVYGSATSWKCIYGETAKKDLRLLRKFQKVSANNLGLWKALRAKRPDIKYLPNGVDTNFFTPVEIDFNPNKIEIGWVGNSDREEKKYHSIFLPAKARSGRKIKFHVIATSKSSSARRLRSVKKMRRFYRNLHFFLVTSSYEGTPNPALEAAACGVPLVTTRVGNMPELVKHRANGFFVKCKIKSILRRLLKLNDITPEYYNLLKNNIRSSVVDGWDWQTAAGRFRTFFED